MAVNDLTDAETNAHLLNMILFTVHFGEVKVTEDEIDQRKTCEGFLEKDLIIFHGGSGYR